MATAIEVLKPFIFPTLRRIAPEKARHLFAILNEKQITFRFIQDNGRILFTADMSNRVISVGEKCLERLWALSFGYFIFYESMAKAKHLDISTTKIPVENDVNLKTAAQLILWATSVDWQAKAGGLAESGSMPEWPNGLPRPIPDPKKESNEDVGDKLFLSAVGFILHHELAHIRFEHVAQNSTDSILNEKEADRAAAEWLLDGFEPDDKEFIQRAFGIAVALLWLAGLAAYVPHTATTHPPGYDRLYQVIFQFVANDRHPVWGLLEIVLEFHLQVSQTPYDEERCKTSPKETVNHYCDVLSKRSSKGTS
jgi:Peptidase U49